VLLTAAGASLGIWRARTVLRRATDLLRDA
jgi:hypothetical protein